jgi:biopolymer transport protein ExbB
MLANVVIDTFVKGGPIMWPLLISSIIALGVVGERFLPAQGLRCAEGG